MIDPNQPVYLKQLTRTSEGNIYHPGKYNPGELPGFLFTPAYVTQEQVMLPDVLTQSQAVEVQNLEISTRTPNTTPKPYLTTPVALVNDLPTTNNELAVELININTATVDSLSALPNVGTATAVKIVENREKQPFVDIKDLSDRVPLPRGKWDDTATKLIF